MQAELIAASSGADSGVWYYTLQVDIPILFGIEKAQAVPLLIDNKAALNAQADAITGAGRRPIAIHPSKVPSLQ